MDVRITYTSKEELEKVLKTLKEKHNIISISKPYPNLRSRNVGEYRVYIKLEF
ncbi:hypothetical protein ACV3U8_12590 [Clostridium perfringens]